MAAKIQFTESDLANPKILMEKLRRFVDQYDRLEREVQLLRSALAGGEAGQRLTKVSGQDLDTTWS